MAKTCGEGCAPGVGVHAIRSAVATALDDAGVDILSQYIRSLVNIGAWDRGSVYQDKKGGQRPEGAGGSSLRPDTERGHFLCAKYHFAAIFRRLNLYACALEVPAKVTWPFRVDGD